MAEAFFQVLIENVSSLIKEEVGLIMGVEKEMKKLANTLTTIQKVLEDAEDKQFQSKAIQYWLSQLNGMAYEIEDLLDECNTEFAKLKGKGNNFLKKVLYKRKVGRRMKEAAEKLEAVAKDRLNFDLKEIVVQQPNQRDWRRETGFILNDPDHVYGRDEERDKIVDLLVNNVSEQKLSVLPIIGLGGMGKTTLAQFVYNDDRVTHHFNTKLWVCVSDNYDLIAILKAIIESATGGRPTLENLASLQGRLLQVLSEKRYLLILDDVWNDNQADWDILKGTVACGSMGSSIVVTTRQQKVADIMGTLPAHCLTELSEEHCWLLFRRRALGQENEQHYGNLEAIGRRIVKKCGGVPLAAKALGGLLRFQRDENEWIRVEESHTWNLPQEENSILPVLRLSYRHLPFVLKRCFVYCAVFPKDYTFYKTELIFHWMAHGCITSNGKREVEDVGDQIWNELSLRSFFQEVDTSGRETTFKMHDLVHDLAQSIMENKIPGTETESSSTNVSNNKIREVHWSKYNSKIISSSIAVEVSTLTTIMNYNRLRILKIMQIDVEELPSEICKLKQLRSFELLDSSIRTLPHTFCCLFNLQILILNHCYQLQSLPKNIRCMSNLRHIFLDACESLSDMPYRIGELASLRTLSLFIVGDTIGNHLGELEHLNLGGRLEIKHVERVKNDLTAKKASLVEKPNLRDLVLRWKGDRTSSESATIREDEKVLEALEPHPNLVTLEINGFRGRELALWMKSMKNITRIDIEECRNCRYLSPLGSLPLLKSLSLWDLEALEYIVEENEVGCETAIFPSLKELQLERLPNVKGWLKEGEVVEMLPNLQSLKIDDCESLRLTSTTGGLNSVTKLVLWNCKIGSSFPEGSLRHLTALQELKMINCMEFEDVSAEEMKHLHLLKDLWLDSIKGMVSLPQALQHIPSLQSLTLYQLSRLTSLPDWLPNLASLTQLHIEACLEIPSLPSSIQGMSNLKLLNIWECPQLKRRCEEPNGEDWHKISHIPGLYIG
ncbi:hypothetical protein ACS0TY_022643 [Phlomoides rotata]